MNRIQIFCVLGVVSIFGSREALCERGTAFISLNGSNVSGSGSAGGSVGIHVPTETTAPTLAGAATPQAMTAANSGTGAGVVAGSSSAAGAVSAGLSPAVAVTQVTVMVAGTTHKGSSGAPHAGTGNAHEADTGAGVAPEGKAESLVPNI